MIKTSAVASGDPSSGVAITSASAVSSGMHIKDDVILVKVTFDENVSVTGTPQLDATLASGAVVLNYQSGSGTKELIFSRTISASDLDLNGPDLIFPVRLNGGTIVRSSTSEAAILSSTTTNLPSMIIDGRDLTFNSISYPANGTYGASDVLEISVSLSHPLAVIGSPFIPVSMGGNVRNFTYSVLSTSTLLRFMYTVQLGEIDADGIDVDFPITPNGATLLSSEGRDVVLPSVDVSRPLVIIDSTAATISSVTVPANNTYRAGDTLTYTVQYPYVMTVSGTPRLPIVLTSGTVYANYTGGTGTNTLTFSHNVATDEVDLNGVLADFPLELNGGTITTPGRSISLSSADIASASVIVDAERLHIDSFTGPSAATYVLGNNLDFVVDFSHAATVSGTPRLPVVIGGATRYANYLSGSGSDLLTFRYTVVSNEVDADGIAVDFPIDQNGGSITAPSRITNYDFTDANLATVLVNSTTATIASITGPSAATYTSGQNLDFTVNYSHVITVTGNPRIVLTVGAVSRHITYVSGSGSTSLLFRYTVVPSEDDNDGLALVNPILLNGGTMTSPGRTVDLSFADQTFSTVFVLTNSSPSFASVSNQVFINGYSQEFFVPFEDADFGDDHTFAATGLAGSNIVLDTNTGNFAIPANAVAGDYSVNLTINDGRSGTDSVAFTLSIAAQGGTFSKNIYSAGVVEAIASPAIGAEFTGWWYVPTAYAAYPSANFCVILNFHGQGEQGTGTTGALDLLGDNYPASGSATASGLVRQVNIHSRHYPCLVFVPQADTSNWIYGHYVRAMREALRKYPRVDRNRIYTMGLSIGGGIQNYLAAAAGQFAAAMIPAGADLRLDSDPSFEPTGDQLITALFPSMWSIIGRTDMRLAHNVKYFDTLLGTNSNSGLIEDDYIEADASTLTHGAFDPILNRWGPWLTTYNDLNSNFRMTNYKGQGHTNTVMTYPYGNDEMLNWLFKKNKDSGIRTSDLKFSHAFSVNTGTTAATLSGKFRDVNGSISKVYANLTSLSGGNWVEMTHSGSGLYSLNYTIPSGLSVGAKRVTVMAFDNNGNHKPYILTHQVSAATISSGVFDQVVMNPLPSNDTLGCTQAGSSLFNAANNTDSGFGSSHFYGSHMNRALNFVTLGSNSGIIAHYLQQQGYTVTRAGAGVAFPYVMYNQGSDLAGPYTAPATAALSRCGILFRRGNLNTPALGYNGLKIKFYGFNPGFNYNVHVISSLYADRYTQGLSSGRSDSVNFTVNSQSLIAQNIWQRKAPFTFNNVALNEDLSIEVELDMLASKDTILNGIIFEQVLP